MNTAIQYFTGSVGVLFYLGVFIILPVTAIIETFKSFSAIIRACIHLYVAAWVSYLAFEGADLTRLLMYGAIVICSFELIHKVSRRANWLFLIPIVYSVVQFWNLMKELSYY